MPFDLTTTFIHLGLGARAIPLPDFSWSPEALDEYGRRFAGDGDEGRLVGLFRQETDWPTWERHPHGEEVVILLSGTADLIQWVDGGERVAPMTAGEAIVNPVGVWHTARVQEPGMMMFITPGRDTENVALADFPPPDGDSC
jgi:mannose-6-phosphate isomerase-like protein (cupin superfamily)